jgi:hypothetical protein
MIESCESCKYFRAAASVVVVVGSAGADTCRRRPPSVFLVAASLTPDGKANVATSAAWPQVPKTAWCGEYERQATES